MKLREGQTIVEWLVVTGIAALTIGIFGTIGFGCWNRHIHGNKQFIDLKQNFNVAYVELDRAKPVVRVNVRKWNDYPESDSVQIITDDGKVYYTHLSRVVLCNEQK